MKKLLLLPITLLLLIFASCDQEEVSGPTSSETNKPNIVHEIFAYQYDDTNGRVFGDCKGYAGIVLGENDKYYYEVHIESIDTLTDEVTDDYKLDVKLPVKWTYDHSEPLAGTKYEGSKYICEDNYEGILMFCRECGKVIYILDHNDESTIMVPGKRLE